MKRLALPLEQVYRQRRQTLPAKRYCYLRDIALGLFLAHPLCLRLCLKFSSTPKVGS